MASFINTASREIREYVVLLTPPIFFIALFVPILKYSLDIHQILFLLVYGMWLVFLYVFLRRSIRIIYRLGQESENLRTPPKLNDPPEDAIQRIKQVRAEYKKVEHRHRPITEYHPQNTLENFVYAIISLWDTIFSWALLGLLFAFLVYFGIYELIISQLQNQGFFSLAYDFFNSIGGILTILAENFFPALKPRDGVIVVTLVAIPGYFFLTTAVNLVLAFEKGNRWFLKRIHDPDGVLRQYESVGYLTLSILYYAVFNFFFNLY